MGIEARILQARPLHMVARKEHASVTAATYRVYGYADTRTGVTSCATVAPCASMPARTGARIRARAVGAGGERDRVRRATMTPLLQQWLLDHGRSRTGQTMPGDRVC